VKPELKTPLPGPKAAELIARDAKAMSPSFTRSYPFVMERGQGCWVTDVDGNRFLDFTAGIAVVTTGHSHPKVVAAIKEQAERFIHMSGTDFYYSRRSSSPNGSKTRSFRARRQRSSSPTPGPRRSRAR